MKCLYCYNPEIVYGKGVFTYQNALDFLKKRKGLLDGVVLSGGESTIHKGFYEFVASIKSEGFKVKIDTNGLNPDVLEKLIQSNLIDFVSLDFKAVEEDFFEITKSSKFECFEETFDLLKNSTVDFEIRTTIHSNLISSEKFKAMVTFLEEKGYSNKYFIQPFRNNVDTLSKLSTSTISKDYKLISSNQFEIEWR